MNGFRPGHEPRPQKPHVHLCLLGSRERHGWLNHGLAGTTITMSHDPRFNLTIESVLDLRGFDSARNYCIDAARKKNADWCLQIDNDVCPKVSPLQMIAEAEPEMQVLAQTYGIFTENSVGLSCGGLHEARGNFYAMETVSTGCIAITSSVWQQLKGPWFRWTTRDNELLTPEWPGCGEDVWFSRECQAADITLWCYTTAAMHLRTFDLTMLCQQAGAK